MTIQDPDNRAWWVEIENLKTALLEDEAEIARHHRDFEQIRSAVHEALDAPARPLSDSREAFRDALRQIRNIVG